MGFGRVAGELGVDANRQAVADDQNWRVAQGQAVAEQLLERSVQVFAGGFVFPGKRTAPEHVGVAGAPANDGVFFFKPVAVFAAGLGHAKQFAKVNEMTLRALLFVQAVSRAAGAPFFDESLWGHGACGGEKGAGPTPPGQTATGWA